MLLRRPELPKSEKMPPPRKKKSASIGARAVGAVAGLALGFSSAWGTYHAFLDRSGQASPFGPLALMIPTAVLIRYALTGQIKP
jgi:hypothetical protein